MAEKIGEIIGRQNGANYSLADVYDGKETVFAKNANMTNVKSALHFDTDTGIINELTSFTDTFYSNGSKVTDATPFVTSENAKFDYALKFEGTEYLDLYGTRTTGTIIRNGEDFKLECWFTIDTSADSDTGTLFSWVISDQRYYSNATKGLSGCVGYNYRYTKNGDGTITGYWGNYAFEIKPNEPLYLVIIANQKTNGGIYINGNRLGNFSKNSNYVFHNMKIGAAKDFVTSGQSYYFVTLAPYFKGTISEFKITSPYTDENFAPPSVSSIKPIIPVKGNIPIRHNGTNKYIPLTSDKGNTTTPCLAVRHNGANYYAIK